MRGCRSVLVIVAVAVLLCAARGAVPPPVAWSPDSLEVSVTPGEPMQRTVTVSVLEDVSASVARVLSDFLPLASLHRETRPQRVSSVSLRPWHGRGTMPYVSVAPLDSPPMAAGSQSTFTLSFHVPAGTPAGTVQGSLYLYARVDAISPPLPIVLNILDSGCYPRNCDDGNVCTMDACMGGRCSHVPLPDGTSCDPYNPYATCQHGMCVHTGAIL